MKTCASRLAVHRGTFNHQSRSHAQASFCEKAEAGQRRHQVQQSSRQHNSLICRQLFIPITSEIGLNHHLSLESHRHQPLDRGFLVLSDLDELFPGSAFTTFATELAHQVTEVIVVAFATFCAFLQELNEFLLVAIDDLRRAIRLSQRHQCDSLTSSTYAEQFRVAGSKLLQERL